MIYKLICSKKLLSFIILIIFVLPSIHNNAIAELILSNKTSTTSSNLNPIETINLVFNSTADIKEKHIITDSWTQLVGNYPKGLIDNGFNNTNNINVRGKSTFVINGTEYLFIGTGNINKKQEINKIVFFPKYP